MDTFRLTQEGGQVHSRSFDVSRCTHLMFNMEREARSTDRRRTASRFAVPVGRYPVVHISLGWGIHEAPLEEYSGTRKPGYIPNEPEPGRCQGPEIHAFRLIQAGWGITEKSM